ncbi:hypothetical protein GUJ93_ZPchr0013g36673 [Zizania palustris]|uniref:Uncharacterized protein n=1 Tax=Zizania palustris TaxID=103762 RepID=A0A8J5WVK3_ZIZPA|nr:hypothetical protein GUJ93_ZPchr0013g36673 [Zizania palustris]
MKDSGLVAATVGSARLRWDLRDGRGRFCYDDITAAVPRSTQRRDLRGDHDSGICATNMADFAWRLLMNYSSHGMEWNGSMSQLRQ